MRLSTRLIIAVTVIILVILLVGIITTLSTFIQLFTQFEIVMFIWVIAVLCVSLLFGTWLAVIEIQARKQRHLRFTPSDQGYYEALLTPQGFIKPADNVPLLVPHTYSPRIEIAAVPPTVIDSHAMPSIAAPPTLQTIIEELTPNALEFIYGLDPETGELVKTQLPKAVHMQLVGGTNMGKSHQATSILTQLVARNDTNQLNLTLIDCEGETTAPFQQLPHVKYVATEPKEAARTLRQLVLELERRDISKQMFPIILVFVEEFLNLRRTMPAEYRDQALDDYTTLALRGRKRGIFLFSIGQTAYTEKAIRDAQMQFFSSMAFAIKPSAARSAGFTNTQLLNRLYTERRPGQFLLERPQGDALLLAPHVNYAEIPSLLDGMRQDEKTRLNTATTDLTVIDKDKTEVLECQRNAHQQCPFQPPYKPKQPKW